MGRCSEQVREPAPTQSRICRNLDLGLLSLQNSRTAPLFRRLCYFVVVVNGYTFSLEGATAQLTRCWEESHGIRRSNAGLGVSRCYEWAWASLPRGALSATCSSLRRSPGSDGQPGAPAAAWVHSRLPWSSQGFSVLGVMPCERPWGSRPVTLFRPSLPLHRNLPLCPTGEVLTCCRGWSSSLWVPHSLYKVAGSPPLSTLTVFSGVQTPSLWVYVTPAIWVVLRGLQGEGLSKAVGACWAEIEDLPKQGRQFLSPRNNPVICSGTRLWNLQDKTCLYALIVCRMGRVDGGDQLKKKRHIFNKHFC